MHEINQLQLEFSNHPQYAPHHHNKPAYGQKVQYATLDEEI